MKSYLQGSPELRLALNEDLQMGKNPNSTYASVTLDDSNFNDCVNLSEFESDQTLSYIPLDGEFDVLSYRMTGDEFRVPFRVFQAI